MPVFPLPTGDIVRFVLIVAGLGVAWSAWSTGTPVDLVIAALGVTVAGAAVVL